MPDVAGLGDELAPFRVFIGNRPTFSFSQELGQYIPLLPTELKEIGLACGNGWRKVFNVYAKLVFAFSASGLKENTAYISWQDYRDKQLLQEGSGTVLCFEPFKISQYSMATVNIIMGRTYAKSLSLPPGLLWLDNEFAIDHAQRLIVCPYFDYRQLSNVKIIRLLALIQQLK